MSVVLLAIVGVFLPIISLFAAVYFLLAGEASLALFFFIWWLLWEE
jgi:hypothetical protein